MKKLGLWSVVMVFALVIIQCKPTSTTTKTTNQDTATEHFLSNIQKVTFATVEDGKVAITTDEMEGFFDRVKKLDMEIQMNKKIDGTREEAVVEYKKHLEASVLEFTAEDKKFINTVFDRAYKLCNAISPSIYPEDIKLIKITPNHYGPGVFYTRDNCIVIPEDAINRGDSEDFLKTMLHEIFHIYSRYNKEKQQALYAHIGYKPLENLPTAPDVLERRILLNPDGVNYGYYLEVTRRDTEEPIKVVPIIYSKYMNYMEDKDDFFGYLQFSMFAFNGNEIEANADGSSTVKISGIKGFYEQIGTNTEYIIHPDEVLADNFILMCLSNEDEKVLDEYKIREPGRKLIKDIEKIIKD